MSYVSKELQIGNISLGGMNPVRLQSMTNTSTNDVEASTAQVIRVAEAGADLVRLTAQGMKEARNLAVIKEKLAKKGYKLPLIADIHYSPDAALEAARHVSKVRINPGNYTDRYKSDKVHFSKEEYEAELTRIQSRLKPLIETCKAHKTALRIGSNHGSLSQRIMSRYGDTPEGMAESAMEFLRICRDLDFHDIVVSMKSSNIRVMTEATLLTIEKMQQEDMYFPVHVGVTEAGDGLEGRIKSALGIGGVLLHGIGDTIRVSLTEAPEKELPSAKWIADTASRNKSFIANLSIPERRPHSQKFILNGKSAPFVILSGKRPEKKGLCDADFYDDEIAALQPVFINPHEKPEISPEKQAGLFVISGDTLDERWNLAEETRSQHPDAPLILKIQSAESLTERFAVEIAVELSLFLYYNKIDGIWLENRSIPEDAVAEVAFGILQASGQRISKTRFISCPSCGRTQFNIEKTLQDVKRKTSHLKGLKIAVMGCIVNGPGEMADADYGYVGMGKGKVALYKGKTQVQRGIPEDEALEALIKLIKLHGDWKEAGTT
ncbi:MAG: (E)-4-hydroxy-3-methylbut-2-enyl-diphosphate synthase [Bacteroidota bacterium]